MKLRPLGAWIGEAERQEELPRHEVVLVLEREGTPVLSPFARPGDGSIRTRRIAILVEAGVDAGAALAIHEGLAAAGAVPSFVGVRIGRLATVDGKGIEIEASFEAKPAVLFDALALPGTNAAQADPARSTMRLPVRASRVRCHLNNLRSTGSATTDSRESRASSKRGGVTAHSLLSSLPVSKERRTTCFTESVEPS